MRHDDEHETVIYEVNLEADAAIEAPFDTWLRDHVADMLQLEGFLAAEVLVDGSAPPGRIRRSVHYRLRSQAALDDYMREHAPHMRQKGVAMFGDRFTAERRTLAHREDFVRGQVSTENCLNCGEVLTGQHCSHCGQRARVRVLSLTGLLRDLVGDLMDWDSRIWRTLRPLAFKPGWLTREYLLGRRTRYTPPFRMYLILSVAFFLLTSVSGDPGSGIVLGPDGEGGANLQISNGTDEERTSTPDAAAPAPAPALDPGRQRIIDSIVSRVPEAEKANVRRDLEREIGGISDDDVGRVTRLVEDPCNEQNLKLEIGPLGEKYEPRLREACRKIMADSKTFGRALYENIPKMMFIFLPLIAAVMFALYLGSGRYYVEHLLFFVHYHAFFFLAGLVIALLDRGAALTADTPVAAGLRTIEGLLTAALVVYVPYYLYRAMRRVYEQGRVVTLVKYSLLGVGYVFFMVITALGLLAYTALTL
ncbi:MAG TPA: DUF4286 family protein [Steroidobacteraceae bacterium]|nr:DUF4286 family protein [Steroidobacteraceae bacterium]